METVVYQDSPLASYLQGEGAAGDSLPHPLPHDSDNDNDFAPPSTSTRRRFAFARSRILKPLAFKPFV
ncbi:Lanosterol synthase (Oxidosqualene--lanosterol cyclase), partial [Ascosphaera pollenicola]